MASYPIVHRCEHEFALQRGVTPGLTPTERLRQIADMGGLVRLPIPLLPKHGSILVPLESINWPQYQRINWPHPQYIYIYIYIYFFDFLICCWGPEWISLDLLSYSIHFALLDVSQDQTGEIRWFQQHPCHLTYPWYCTARCTCRWTAEAGH